MNWKHSKDAAEREQALRELFSGRGYYEELKRAINCNDSDWIKIIAKEEYAQRHNPARQTALILGLGQWLSDIFAEDHWYIARRALVSDNWRESAPSPAPHITKPRIGGVERRNSRAESVGLSRAKFVARLLGELNALRPVMELPEEDYPKRRREIPTIRYSKSARKIPPQHGG